jgi:hypothetical protein
MIIYIRLLINNLIFKVIKIDKINNFNIKKYVYRI